MWWILLGICLVLLFWAVYSTQRILYPKRHRLRIPTPLPVFSTHSLTAYDGSPFDVWLLEAAHVGIFASDPQRYCDRVAEFFGRALA